MLSSDRVLFVRSKLSEGKTAPRATSPPRMRPKKPMGTPQSIEIGEWAEESQLKKALMSQKEPSKIPEG